MYYGINLRFKNFFNGLFIIYLYVLFKINIKILVDYKKWLFYGMLWRIMRN